MLAIARAMVNPNRLLLIDEPSKGLAPIVVEHLTEAPRAMKRSLTVVLVEQNLVMAEALGDFASSTTGAPSTLARWRRWPPTPRPSSYLGSDPCRPRPRSLPSRLALPPSDRAT
jgi:ABC-type nitrate/sulfonate/bicarbonate transport system ATPase subunit